MGASLHYQATGVDEFSLLGLRVDLTVFQDALGFRENLNGDSNELYFRLGSSVLKKFLASCMTASIGSAPFLHVWGSGPVRFQ